MTRGRKNPLYQGLPLRLQRTRLAAGISRRQLAEQAGVAIGVADYIETARRVPGIDTIERIAIALAVSPCWLAYGEEGFAPFRQKRRREQTPPQEDPAPGSGTGCAHQGVGQRLRKTREERGLTWTALGMAAGLTSTGVRAIEDGRTTPRADTLERLAHALDVAPCWLAYGAQVAPEQG